MPQKVRINHVAVVTDDLEAALRFWQDALGLEVEALPEVPQEGVRVAFLPVGESHLEIVLPTRADTGVARFLQKRGPGLHHICLEVENLETVLERLKAHGVRLIHETPQNAPDGRRYIFIHPRSAGGVLVELYEAASGG